MLEKIKSDIKKYFYNENIIFEEVNQWRTNLNFFVKNNWKEYFIRTSISKVKDILFWWLLEKEEKILKILGSKLLSPKLIYSFISEDYWFLIIIFRNRLERNTGCWCVRVFRKFSVYFVT